MIVKYLLSFEHFSCVTEPDFISSQLEFSTSVPSKLLVFIHLPKLIICMDTLCKSSPSVTFYILSVIYMKREEYTRTDLLEIDICERRNNTENA